MSVPKPISLPPCQFQIPRYSHLAAGVNDLPVPNIHEVVVSLPRVLVIDLAPHVLLLLQNLAHVLDDELPSSDVLYREKPKALCACSPLRKGTGGRND